MGPVAASWNTEGKQATQYLHWPIYNYPYLQCLWEMILSNEQKFNGENLLKWNINMTQLLGPKALLGYVNGNITKPTHSPSGTPDLTTPIYSTNLNVDEWMFHDQLAWGHITLNCTDVAIRWGLWYSETHQTLPNAEGCCRQPERFSDGKWDLEGNYNLFHSTYDKMAPGYSFALSNDFCCWYLLNAHSARHDTWQGDVEQTHEH